MGNDSNRYRKSGIIDVTLTMEEHFFQCPYCWESISMLVDISLSKQSYIEDCEVCCNPIQLSISTENSEIIAFEAQNIEQ